MSKQQPAPELSQQPPVEDDTPFRKQRAKVVEAVRQLSDTDKGKNQLRRIFYILFRES